MPEQRRAAASWLTLCACALLSGGARAQGVVAVHAPAGATVALPCPSVDGDHVFRFWTLADDRVVGPGNNQLVDGHHGNAVDKYKYDVLSGTLSVRGVSTAEGGFYRCVSAHVSGAGELRVRAVQLLVRNDWETEFETDATANVARGVVAATVLLAAVLAAGGATLLCCRRRREQIRRMERELAEPEEGREGLLRHTYNPTTLPSTSSVGADVDTDFPAAFSTLHSTH